MRTAFIAVALFIAMCIACTFAVEHMRLEAVPSETEAQTLFQKFKVDYEISYKSAAEEAQKFVVFQENLKEIVRLNNINNKATFVINKFADWTKAERKALSGTRIPDHLVQARLAEVNATELPGNPSPIDWRQHGVVTPIKDQAQCGSCWAFSTTECIESAWALAGKGLNVLSPQNVLDCSNAGSCNGGNPNNAINAMKNGIDFDSAYPYIAQDQSCRFNSNAIGAYTAGATAVGASEAALAAQMVFSPVGIAIDAENIGFFGSGYMNSGNCDHSGIDHAVQAVGLKLANDGTLVWIVRNSWNTWWGDQGYFYIAYGQGACLIGQWSYFANA